MILPLFVDSMTLNIVCFVLNVNVKIYQQYISWEMSAAMAYNVLTADDNSPGNWQSVAIGVNQSQLTDSEKHWILETPLFWGWFLLVMTFHLIKPHQSLINKFLSVKY